METCQRNDFFDDLIRGEFVRKMKYLPEGGGTGIAGAGDLF